jgi:hypothetical protein
LVRTAFAESRGRYETLFRDHPPTLRLQFVDRVVMHKGDPPDPDISMQVWDKKKDAFVLRSLARQPAMNGWFGIKRRPTLALLRNGWLQSAAI